MSEAFAAAEDFEKRPVSGALKVQAWELFAAAYPENDPYSQDDERMRREARARIAALQPKLAFLSVRSNVADDAVWIDGQSVGPTGAAAHEVAPGWHTVRVEKDGYRTWEETLVLAAGERRTLSAELDALAAGAADMVFVPGGEFFSGCNEKVDRQCDDDETPGKRRHVSAFSIDRTEVTVAAYAACVDRGVCDAPDTGGSCNAGQSGRERHPVNCVSWNQAKEYCGWKGKRLPTESEWEKAARGTDGRKFPWGNKGFPEAGRVANIADRRTDFSWKPEDYDDGFAETAPVGTDPSGASPSGALDMSGNVWEWTSSEYPGVTGRVFRGGSWNNEPRNARASDRLRSDPRLRSEAVGFRCAQ